MDITIDTRDPRAVLKYANELVQQQPDKAARVFAALLRSPSLHADSERDTLFVRLTANQAMAELASQQLTAEHFSRAVTVLSHGLQVASLLPMPSPAATPPSDYEVATATRVLFETVADLAHQGIVALPFGGVLLGLVREGALLKGDKDLDVIVPLPHYNSALKAVAAAGWQPGWIPVNASNFKCFRHPDTGLTLDLFAYDFDSRPGKVQGGWWPQGLPRETGRLLEFERFAWQPATYQGRLYWQVSEPEQILEQLYGPNWRIPDADYDASLETPALQAFNTFARAWCYLRLLEAWMLGRPCVLRRRLNSLARLDPDAEPLSWFAALLKDE